MGILDCWGKENLKIKRRAKKDAVPSVLLYVDAAYFVPCLYKMGEKRLLCDSVQMHQKGCVVKVP